MEFSAHRAIAAPQGDVFWAAANFRRMERHALARGARLVRLDDRSAGQSGARWRIAFVWTGYSRTFDARVARFDPPHAFVVTDGSPGMDAVLTVETRALAVDRTGFAITCVFTPTSVSARLQVQTARLVKSGLDRRLDLLLASFAAKIEKRQPRRGSVG